MDPELSTRDPDAIRRLALEMAAAGPAAGRQLRITVAGDSMAPSLQKGDRIIVRPGNPGDWNPGAIVTFLAPAGPITHRIVLADADRWIAKGDNARSLDPPIGPAEMIGLVVQVERGAETRPVRCDRRAARIARFSLLEGRVTARFPLERRSGPWFRLVNLPFRLLVAASAQPLLSR